MHKKIKAFEKTEKKALKQTKSLLKEDKKHDKIIDKAESMIHSKNKKHK